MARTHPAFALLLLALAFLAAACSNTQVPDLRQEVEREGIIPEDWQAMPLRVGLAPMRATGGMEAVSNNAEDTRRWVVSPDAERMNGGPESLHYKLLSAFREFRVFDEIATIENATPETTHAELQAQALRQGLDFVIVPTLRRQDVGYVGSNGAYGWNMFVWWMVSPVLSWWIADEDFDAHVHVDLVLYPASGEAELAETQLEPPEPVVRSLDVWDEGFNLFSIYTTPRHFDESNWNRISDLLIPIADLELQKSALRYATGELNEMRRDAAFQERVRRRVGLVIGVDRVLPVTRHAMNDAQQFAAQLTEARDMRVSEAALRTIVGAQATERAVRQSAAELSRLARLNDDVILYFSGVGSVAADGGLVLQLTELHAGEVESLRLETLLGILLRNRPRSLTLVLDCSFTAPGDPRCAAPPRVLETLRQQGSTGSLYQQVIDQCRALGVECVILAASDAVIDSAAPMPALEIEELSHGLFTSYALLALAGEANSATGSPVTVDEFIEYTRRNVSRIGSLEGTSQAGWFHVDEGLGARHLPTGRRYPAPDG